MDANDTKIVYCSPIVKGWTRDSTANAQCDCEIVPNGASSYSHGISRWGDSATRRSLRIFEVLSAGCIIQPPREVREVIKSGGILYSRVAHTCARILPLFARSFYLSLVHSTVSNLSFLTSLGGSVGTVRCLHVLLSFLEVIGRRKNEWKLTE